MGDQEPEDLAALLNSGDEDVQTGVHCALQFAVGHLGDDRAEGRRYAMTVDEVAAIHIYTQETQLYQTLNATLAAQNHVAVKPFLPYIKLLLTALYKLPVVKGSVTRGVDKRMGNLSETYVEQQPVKLWRFNSSTRTVEVMGKFLVDDEHGAVPDGSLFLLQVLTGVDVKSFSANDTEDEVLLLPGTNYHVHSTVTLREDHGRELRMAQLDETEDASSLGYKREDFQRQYCLRVPCCPCLNVSHGRLVKFLKEGIEFDKMMEESRPGCSPKCDCFKVLLREYWLSFIHVFGKLCCLISIVACIWFFLVLLVILDGSKLQKQLEHFCGCEHPKWTLAGLFLFVIAPCFHCCFNSRFAGRWDFRRWLHNRNVNRDLSAFETLLADQVV